MFAARLVYPRPSTSAVASASLTQSAKLPGHVQLTWYDQAGEPYSDSQYKSLDDAVEAALADGLSPDNIRGSDAAKVEQAFARARRRRDANDRFWLTGKLEDLEDEGGAATIGFMLIALGVVAAGIAVAKWVRTRR